MRRGMLLVLVLVGATIVPTTHAQVSCVALAVWAEDPAGDASVTIDGQPTAGSLDLLAIQIGESGEGCDRLDLVVEADEDALEQLGADAAEEAGIVGTGTMAARVVVDLVEDGLAEEDHRVEFVYVVEAEFLGALLGGEGRVQQTWVEHYVDGDLVASTESGGQDNLTHTQDGGTVQASILKAAIGVGGWTGVEASTQEDDETSGTLSELAIAGPGDMAEDGEAYTIGHGLDNQTADIDADGLNDPWERDHFGNLSADADEDPDGDGYHNAAELAAGTDPNDGSSHPSTAPPPPSPPAEPAPSDDDEDDIVLGDDPASGDDEGPKDTPAPNLLLVGIGLLVSALIRRRR